MLQLRDLKKISIAQDVELLSAVKLRASKCCDET